MIHDERGTIFVDQNLKFDTMKLLFRINLFWKNFFLCQIGFFLELFSFWKNLFFFFSFNEYLASAHLLEQIKIWKAIEAKDMYHQSYVNKFYFNFRDIEGLSEILKDCLQVCSSFTQSSIVKKSRLSCFLFAKIICVHGSSVFLNKVFWTLLGILF